MSSLNQHLGWEKSYNLSQQITLAKSSNPKLFNIKLPSDDVRVERGQLKRASSKGIVGQCLSVWKATAMSRMPTIQAKDKKVKEYFDKWTENIGKNGGSGTWRDALTNIVGYKLQFGICPMHLIYNQDDTEILDLDTIDPEVFDYAKSSMGKIVFDDLGKPAGYTIKSSLPGGDPKPMDVHLTEQRFLLPKRVALFKYMNLGDEFYPFGRVEIAYNSIRNESASENTLVLFGLRFPMLVAKHGDPTHEPLEEGSINLGESVANANFENGVSTAYYNEILVVDPSPDGIIKRCEHYTEKVASAMGVPLIYATMKPAQSENRATLRIETGMYILSVMSLLDDTCRHVEDLIFSKICELKGFKEVPKLKWPEVEVPGIESEADKSKGKPEEKKKEEPSENTTSEDYGN